MRPLTPALLAAGLVGPLSLFAETSVGLVLNQQHYLEMAGLNVMLASDYYPEGHQGGVGIIQNGVRVATNGDLRLDRTPGQWQPTSVTGERSFDAATGTISVGMSYPDEKKDRKGFNPIVYPDLRMNYTVRVVPEGARFRIIVDLDEALPSQFVGQVGFLLELFPGHLFGKGYQLDSQTGYFPLQPESPGHLSPTGEYTIDAMARGRRLAVAPEEPSQRLVIEALAGGDLELIDGRGPHSNGWFIVRSEVKAGATTKAIEWLVEPNVLPDFKAQPVLQISQIGYTPGETKELVIELDPRDQARPPVEVRRIHPDGSETVAATPEAKHWGRFLRSDYLRADFSSLREPGLYRIHYGTTKSQPFRIAADVLERGVWQPTLEYFLPVQMCHVAVRDRYRIWHGYCHLDDARMAPVNLNHFDGYTQGPSTLTSFQPGERVPGLDRGGWHDAGDHDLRVESQVETIYGLVLAHETFAPHWDQTTVDQTNRYVEIHRPDGKDDLLQQIEHGLLSVVEGYKSLGRLYRGIQDPTLHQYVLLGDPANATDNIPFDASKAGPTPPAVGLRGAPDDRWVFTEENAYRELESCKALAAAARAMRGYNDALAIASEKAAVELWERAQGNPPGMRIAAATELLLTTGDGRFAGYLKTHAGELDRSFARVGWIVARAVERVGAPEFTATVRALVEKHAQETARLADETPYGVPYKPDIWGAGWTIQNFGMKEYFLHRAFPDLVPDTYFLNAFRFILGRHPGQNNASFVSGVGARSATVAYGFNRADWSYIPGGIVSGTAIIRPDYPELLEWPFLWQQTEYVLGGGTTDYLLLALAAKTTLGPK